MQAVGEESKVESPFSELEKSPEYAANEEGYAIKSSQREDGTWRHPRKVKPGYRPIQELPKYRPPSLKDTPKQRSTPALPKHEETPKKPEDLRTPAEEKKMTEQKAKPQKRKDKKVKWVKKGEQAKPDHGVSRGFTLAAQAHSHLQAKGDLTVLIKMRKNQSSQAYTFSSVISGLSDLADDVSDISLSVATPKESHYPDSLKHKFQEFLRERTEENKEEDEAREEDSLNWQKQDPTAFSTPLISKEVYRKLEPEIREIFDELIPSNSKDMFMTPLNGLLKSKITDLFKTSEKSEGDILNAEIRYHSRVLEVLEEFRRNLLQTQENNDAAQLLEILLEEDDFAFKRQKKVVKPKIDFDLFLSSSSDQERQYSFNTGSYVEIPSRLSVPHLTDLTLTIKPLTPEQLQKFRASQKERYSYPERPWIFSTSDKRNAVVGPVVSDKSRATYSLSIQDVRAPKPLGGQFLKESPPFITLPILVKDALAKLPNGMGTIADTVEMLKASSFVTIPESRLSRLFSIVKVILTDLSHRGDQPHLLTSEGDCSVSRHSQVKEVWVYASSGKSIDDWMKAADIEKRKPKLKQKESSRKIKIPLDQTLLKSKKSFTEEPPLSKKAKL